jgi:hypothetical protein
MMRTYRLLVRREREVLEAAGAASLFEASVFKDLCFVAKALTQA